MGKQKRARKAAKKRRQRLVEAIAHQTVTTVGTLISGGSIAVLVHYLNNR